MKKIFTFAAAILVSASLWADSVTFSATEMSEQAEGVTKGAVTALCPTKAGDQQWYKNSSTIKGKAISLGSSADTAVIVPSNGKSIHFRMTEGYTITGISIEAAASKDSTCGEPIVIWTEEINKTPAYVGNIEIPARNLTEKPAAVEVDNIPAGATAFAVYRRIKYNVSTGEIGSGSNFGRSQQTWNVFNVTVTYEAATPSTDPVTAAEISGEDACALGGSVELTCTAAKATAYQWYLGGAAIEGATAKKYTFTPTAAGQYSFTCAASNEYNTDPVMAAAFVVTVTDPASACGELIKAVLNGGTSATMSGVLGGTFDTNLGSGKYKLDKGKYIGVQLAAGTFMAGDVVTITMSAAGQNYPCLFADKDRNTCLFLATEVSTETEYQITLPAAANGLTAIYLSRGDDTDAYKWNPTVSSISVTRSCEASNNANIAKVWVMAGDDEMVFTPEEDGVTYNLVVPATEDIAQLSINFSLEHPLATANVASPLVINVPAAGAAANSQQIVVTAQDGSTQKTYTINVSKSASASTDASLKSLSVTGYTLNPIFAANVYEYTITKAYGAENPGTNVVVYEPNDATAHPVVTAQENALVVTVTAEDGQTQLIYTINIVEAAAKKAILCATFSNGVHGYIAGNEINVPYLAGEAEPTFVNATFWNADGEPTAAIVEGNLVVTGIDGLTDTYTINYVALTPMGISNLEVTFENVPSYIYSVYGWDAEKGVKFSKDVEEASNHRISEGKDRIYIALPAGKEVLLTSGSGAERPVTITVNGQVSEITKTAKKNETITLPLSASHANFIAIESNNGNGDGGFIKMKMNGWPTAIDNTNDAVKAVKVVRNGQLFIEKNGVIYNAQGAIVK